MKLGKTKDAGQDLVQVIPTGSPDRDGWFAKAVGFVVRRLTLINREGWGGDATTSGESVTTESLLGLSSAWACVNLLAGTIGTLPWNVWRTNPRNGFPEVASGHWLQLLFNAPNLDQTRVDFLEYLAASLELHGNAYCRKGRLVDGGAIVSLVPYNPEPGAVAVRRRSDTGALEYRFADWRGNIETLPASEVWHIRGFGGHPLGGLSTLAFGRQAFGLSQALDRVASATFRNGARPSGALSYADWLTEPRKIQARASLDGFTGAANAGKPLLLEGGVKWEQLSFAPEEAQMLQSRAFGVEEICRFFGVPPVLVGHTEKVSSWGTGIGEIVLGFVKFTLRRRVKRMETSADLQLLSAAERGQGLFTRFDLEGLLRADSKGRAAFYEVMTRAGVMTINECRRLENLPPVPGGDVPRMQAQNVPIGAALQAVPVPSADD